VIIAWIPADFGMMFYTSHVGQNAAREGARIASADPALPGGLPLTCNLPCTGADDLLQRIAHRVAAGLMSNAGSSVTLDAAGLVTTCDREVRVRVTQIYYPFFYRILRFMGFSVPPSVTMDREARMRYEHQC